MKNVFSMFDEKSFDIVALQETHWNDQLIESYKHLWNGNTIYRNYETSSRGVAFLLKNSINSSIEFVNSVEGRFLHIRYRENNENFDIINLYAPNACKERTLFFLQIY
jgi:exonuclease III